MNYLSLPKWIALSISIFTIFSISVYSYFYINTQMSSTNHAININKLEEVNKTFTYNVYSDFYYSATKFDDDGKRVSIFSEIIPVETRIGFDFLSHKVLINSLTKDPEILIDKNGIDIPLLDTMRSFALTFGEIFATQDQHYFNAATERFENIYKALYQQELTIEIPKTHDYYEETKSLAVSNLKLTMFKLKDIDNNLKSFKLTPLGEWSPNLIEYKFGEDDIIHLQYMNRTIDEKLEKEILSDENRKNKIVFKTIKVNNNNVQSLLFTFEGQSTGSSKNLITAYYQDDNGYNYLLRFYPKNEKSFKKYLPDFLKLAYSLYFVDIVNFNNEFASKQDESQKIYREYISFIKENKKNYEELRKELLQNGYVTHFSLPELNMDIKEYESPKKQWWIFDDNTKLVRFDQALDNYYAIYGEYPLNYNATNYLASVINDYQIVKEASEKNLSMSGKEIKLYLRTTIDSVDIKKLCKDIECIKKLKKDGW